MKRTLIAFILFLLVVGLPAPISTEAATIDATVACNGDNLEITINGGDAPFELNATGSGTWPRVVGIPNTYIVNGPDLWQNVTITELSGDGEIINFGDFNCGTASVTVLPTTVNVSELGPTSTTYDVVLDISPNIGETVTVTPINFDPVQGVTVTPANVSFDSTNWFTAQSITVTAVDDAVIETTPHIDTIDHSVSTTGGIYNGVTPLSVIVNIDDNDTPGIAILPITVTTGEDGTSGTFDVFLNTMPSAPVDVDFTGVDATEGSLDITTINFTTSNWATPITVTVTGLDDAIDDGDITYTITGTGTSGDGNYNASTTTVDVTNIDDEVTALVASVVCNVNNLEVTITAGDSGFGILGTGPSLPIIEVPTGTYILTGPGVWTGVAVTEFSGDGETINFGDFTTPCGLTPSVSISPLTVTVNETGPTAAIYNIVLTAPPNGGEIVTITPTGFDTVQGVMVTPANLGFDSTDWNTPQSFTVTAVDDLIMEINPHTDTINHTVGTTGGVYGGVLAASVTANITDNDTAGISITPLTITTSEDGTTAGFDVVITSQPTSAVDVDFTGVDVTEGSLDITTINFTTSNWATPVTVTATGVDDALADGDITYTVTGTASSSDTFYGGLTATVDITNTDNEVALVASVACNGDNLDVTITDGDTPFNITGTGSGLPQNGVVAGVYPLTGPSTWQGVTITEVGGDGEVLNLGDFNCGSLNLTVGDMNVPESTSTGLTVSLSQAVPNDTTVNFTVTDGTATGGGVDYTMVTTSPLIIPANSISATIDFQTVNDITQEPNEDFQITITSATNPLINPTINGSPATITIIDTDIAGISPTPDSGLITTESGVSDTFLVYMGSMPAEDVTFFFTSSDLTEGTVIASITIAPANWDLPPPITITGVDDILADGDINYSIDILASSLDPFYDGLTASVNVTNIDNETAGLNAVPGTLDIAEINQPPLLPTSFNVWLISPPQAGEIVTVNMTYDATQLTLDTASLAFDDVNWNTPQPVNITAIADGIPEPNMVRNIDLLSVSSLGGGSPSAGLTAQVVVTIYDDGANIVGHVPNHGLIKIDNWQTQNLYQSPSHGVIRLSDMSELYIPQDYDGNGFDTYNVVDIRAYNGETWLGLWIGNMSWGWVPYNPEMMSIIEPLDWDIQSEWTP